MKFTEEQLDMFQTDEGWWEGDEELIEVVERKITYVDTSKGYYEEEFVIHDIKTDTYWRGKLEKSPDWDGMSEYNFKNQKWKEVYPYTETVTKYK